MSTVRPPADPESDPRVRAVFDDMRAWLAHLAATDRLAVIRDGVSLEFELAAIAKRLDGTKATFYYTAENRIDFRDLIRKLVAIELSN